MSRNKVSYEWAVQIVDRESGDIDHSDFSLKLGAYEHDELWYAITSIPRFMDYFERLVLIRYWGNEDDGEQDREHAEVHQAFKVIDGQAIMIRHEWQLPSHFDCSTNSVSLRFHKELASAIKRLKPIATRRRWSMERKS